MKRKPKMFLGCASYVPCLFWLELSVTTGLEYTKSSNIVANAHFGLSVFYEDDGALEDINIASFHEDCRNRNLFYDRHPQHLCHEFLPNRSNMMAVTILTSFRRPVYRVNTLQGQ